MTCKGGEERCVEGVGGETKRKEIHVEDLDIHDMIILKCV
jgi:hypothetical protein